MNEAEGTLLFDSWTLDQTFVPDVDQPRRWRLGCVLKCRQVPEMLGPYPADCRDRRYAVGWNHDFKLDSPRSGQPTGLGWQFIMMKCQGAAAGAGWTPHGTCHDGFVPRYPYRAFRDLFCDEPTENCLPAEGVTCAGAQPGAIAAGGTSEDSVADTLAQIVEDAKGVAERKRLREQNQ